MFVKGIRLVGVGEIRHTLTGEQPSPATVSRVYHSLQAECEAWKARRLPDRYVYVFADGTYCSVIYGDEAHTTPILRWSASPPRGRRKLIAFTIDERENQAAWEKLLDDLRARGVQHVDLWITEGHKAMLNAIALKFPASQRQRCFEHQLENVLARVPAKQRDAVAAECFCQPNRAAADQQAFAFRPAPSRAWIETGRRD